MEYLNQVLGVKVMYDPKKLAAGNSVDRLSLALALDKDRDERVEEAVEEMLEQVWRDINGQRN